ncbi:propionyl-coenzyme A carboxylase alpha polypeptide [Mesorhizobium sp. WSM4303]|nr:propionyl-coenzyme A carboxylase alpha polypeptide [Mesorhizobium sp. WSM4306]TRD06371.1 propionyl-coenzyme A carboxylase alpha polypeptide [Mesorhizobium sp. WSM4303]
MLPTPSVLPDISPARGRSAASTLRPFLQDLRLAKAAEHVISPLAGEMPGRAEGGAVPPTRGRRA